MRRGEVYMVDLSPVTGKEQSGRRPVVVISSDDVNRIPLVVSVLPGTNGSHLLHDSDWNVRVHAPEGGLVFDTVFPGFQLRALDKGRFPPRPIGKLSDSTMKAIDAALIRTLGITV